MFLMNVPKRSTVFTMHEKALDGKEPKRIRPDSRRRSGWRKRGAVAGGQTLSDRRRRHSSIRAPSREVGAEGAPAGAASAWSAERLRAAGQGQRERAAARIGSAAMADPARADLRRRLREGRCRLVLQVAVSQIGGGFYWPETGAMMASRRSGVLSTRSSCG